MLFHRLFQLGRKLDAKLNLAQHYQTIYDNELSQPPMALTTRTVKSGILGTILTSKNFHFMLITNL